MKRGLSTVTTRHPPEVHTTEAAGGQGPGASLSSFLPPGITPDQALELALIVDPFGRAIDLALTNRDRANCKRVITDPKHITNGRHMVIRQLTKIAEKLKPLQASLMGKVAY